MIKELKKDLLHYNESKINSRSKKRLKVTDVLFTMLLNVGFQSIVLYRLSNLLYKLKVPLLPYIIDSFNRWWSGNDISHQAKIGEGLLFVHGMGIVIGAGTKIGKHVKIMNDVTIGNRLGGNDRGMATIGDNVVIGVGARILGKLKIDENAKIGANAVLLIDVPKNAVAVGVPAKVLIKEKINE